MAFSSRDPEVLSPSIAVTLVTTTGACTRQAVRRTMLIGSCERDPENTTAIQALEVQSCPELTRPADDLPHLSTPLMVGVLGHFPGATLESWPTGETQPLSAAQIQALQPDLQEMRRYDSRATLNGVVFTPFEDSSWGWARVDEDPVLFRGDRRIDPLDMTAAAPLRVRVGSRLLTGVGNAGHHGYGFYMFPAHARQGQVRWSGYPAVSCSSF